MVTTEVASVVPRERQSARAASAPKQKASPFNKGALKRIHMVNFMSYNNATVMLGSRLNHILGPNGSGKSAILAAVVLGLGGSPKLLERGDSVKAYVSHGCNEDAIIEVELIMDEGQPCMTIKRQFCARSNSSKWFINGRSAPERAVKEKVLELGIQVDNLCTILPQELVGDFSGFSADTLLLETEKTLSPERLHKPHLKLSELQKSSGKKVNETDTLTKKVDVLRSELTSLEHDLQRFHERQAMEDKLDVHKKGKLWVHAAHLSAEGVAKKKILKAALADLKESEACDKPLREEEVKWERENLRLRNMVDSRQKSRKASLKEADEVDARIERLAGSAITAKEEIANIDTRRKKKEAKLANDKAKLVMLTKKLAELTLQVADMSGQSEAIKADRDFVQEKKMALEDDFNVQKSMREQAMRGIAAVENKIKELSNAHAAREKRFRDAHRENAEIGFAVRKWAAENTDRLNGSVTGPIGLEVTVDDEDAATAVEFHVPSHTWCSMVVDSKEDHDTIIEAFKNQNRSLGLLVNEGGGLKPYRPTFSAEEMTTLHETAGVRGYLDEYISCSDSIRQILRRNTMIHKAFLGNAATQLKMASDSSFLKSLGRSASGAPSGCVIYAGGGHSLAPGQPLENLQQYHAKISLYGQRTASTRVTETRAARMVGKGVDEDAVKEQQDKKKALELRVKTATDKMAKINASIGPLKAEEEECTKKLANLEGHRKQEKSLQATVARAQRSIEVLEKELEASEEVAKVKHMNRLEEVFKLHASAVGDAQGHLSSMLDASIEIIAASLAKNAVAKNLADAKEALALSQTSRKELEDNVDELKREQSNLKREFMAAKNLAIQVAPRCHENGEDTDFGRQFHDLPVNMDELDAVIDVLETKLNSIVSNPAVVEKYNKIKKEVEEAEKLLQELTTSNESAGLEMKTIHDAWTVELKRVVHKLDERFQEYMSEGNCEGQVVLRENESSYEKWGIVIRVRFRAVEEGGILSDLSSRVQSGGERSVATIQYLMAMQDLQASPFRMADEINQGMDAKNERRVVSRIVRNSCGPARKQFILITPKLLQGLVSMDNEDVTVVIVMNGVNALAGTQDHTMAKFIAAKKRQLGLREDDGPAPKEPRR